MSKKGNVMQTQTPQAETGQAQDAATTLTTDVAAGAADAAVVLPAQASTVQDAPPAPDEHHGRGGMYTVTNGQRVLTHRTQAEHEAGAADATQPATPVNPDTTE